MLSRDFFLRLAFVATLLALCVVVLGAYVRLSHAGLGCPDWPGCYGQLGAPSSDGARHAASQVFPERPVETAKAWKEMIHRYFAGTLGLLIAALAGIAWTRRKAPGQPVVLPIVLVGLVIFQALLGMWTVTLLLQPVIVMSHLLGGMTTLALLWWLTLRSGGLRADPAGSMTATAPLRPLALLALIMVYIQLSLGGWTSSNYAALACGDFPMCQNSWWPAMDFADGFSLPQPTGSDFEGGLHGPEGRTAIHVTHRIGAVLTLLIVGWLGIRTLRSSAPAMVRKVAVAMLVLLATQFSLGIANVLLSLPLPIAVLHNGVAALLLLSVVTMLHVLRPTRAAL